MGYIIFGIVVLTFVGIIWMIKRAIQTESKRYQRFKHYAEERGLNYSFAKIGVGGFNTVKGRINGSNFSLSELPAGTGRKNIYHKTVAIMEDSKLDFSFVIGGKYAYGVPKDLGQLKSYDLGVTNSKLVARTNDPQKFKLLLTSSWLQELRELENDFESAIIGHNQKLMYTVNVLLPNEKRFKSYRKIVDSMSERGIHGHGSR